MSASNLPPTSYATIKRWEEAGASLMAAFNHYVDTCAEIGIDPLSRFVRPEDLGPRVDSILKNVHAAISDQLPKTTTTLLRTRNILESPVLRFPREILLEIFMSFVFDYKQGPQVHISMKDGVHHLYARLYTLCGVCSAWRDIVMTRGALWSVLPLGSRQDTWNPEAFYRSLQRAGASRLHLTAHDDGTEHWKDAFMQLMSEHGTRFRTVNLVSNDLKRVRGFVRTLLNHVATGPLSELSIKTRSKLEYHPLYELDDDWEGERDWDGYIFPGNPRQHSTVIRVLESLTAFRISGVRVNWNNVSFSSRLVELQIWNITLGYDNTIVTFLQSLSSAPELCDLHIIRVHTFRDQSAPIKTDALAPIVFPTLKTLFLQGLYFNTFKLISALIAPGQYRVTLQFDYRFARIRKPGREIHPCIYDREYMGDDDRVEAFDVAELSAALGRVQADTLRLEGGFHLRKALLRRVLRGLPGLKTLVLYDWVFDANDHYRSPDDFWRDSPRSSLPDDKIPALENLILVSCEVYLQSISSFLNMVSSHPLRRINFFNTYVGDRNDERYNHLYIADSERSRKIVKMIEWLRNKIPEVRMVDDHSILHGTYYYRREWELW